MSTGRRVGARELLDTVLDAGSWQSWDAPPLQVAEPGSAYAAELEAAADKAGTDESLLTGTGTLQGRRVAVVVGEFGFLAGSIGRAAAERLVLAVERATREGLPLFAAPTSGGTRMQEGTRAFVGMVKISAAVAAHKEAGLPYIVYLRHPTTGGVFASWGSLGHLTVAEPGALVGFLGPRVYEALYDAPFPPDVQTSENLYEHGLLDAVLPIESLAEVAARALNVLMAPREGLPVVPELPRESLPDLHAWESITRSRRPERPGVRALLKLGASDVVPLHGTGQGEQDPGLLIALARFGGAPCVVLGQDRRHQTMDHPLGPAGLREARRGMRLAHELKLPLVSVIDTAGAALSKEAEEGGLAGEIARCLAELVMLDAPTVCVLLGQGTGGGALALMPADRVICAQHSLAVAAAARGRVGDPVPRHRPRPRARRLPGGALAGPAAGRRRRPDRGRAPRRGGRAGGLLRPDGAGARARARAAAAGRPGDPAGRPAGAVPRAGMRTAHASVR